jgi:acyl-CoA synthetase (AMP-forming)/AMP-acid ligase II
VLLRQPDLVEASVVGRPPPDWGEEIIAFLVARDGATVVAAELDPIKYRFAIECSKPARVGSGSLFWPLD